MADWPDIYEVFQVLDIDNQEAWETTVTRVREAAIAKVKADVGNWTVDDEPTDSLAQAALRMCELISLRPEAAAETSNDPTYMRLLKGRRRRFGIASASTAWLEAHPET